MKRAKAPTARPWRSPEILLLEGRSYRRREADSASRSATANVYGIVATTVERRRSEVAIHLALGATVQRVFHMVLGHAMRSVVLGIGVGLASAVLGGRAITAFLYEVAPHDSTVLSAASLLVVTVAVVACLRPIVRAVQTPTTILLKPE